MTWPETKPAPSLTRNDTVCAMSSGCPARPTGMAAARCCTYSSQSAPSRAAVALVASMAGLAYAMRGLPVGTAYAVWVGIGAALTAGYAMWTGQEPVTVVRVLLLMGIVGCVVGLKLTH